MESNRVKVARDLETDPSFVVVVSVEAEFLQMIVAAFETGPFIVVNAGVCVDLLLVAIWGN